MEFVIANAASKARSEKLNGRDYLVAPATLIVPGVLNGSKGALYYPPEETSKDPWAWNGMPLILRHPVGSDGQHVSGRSPGVFDKSGLGWLWNAKANGKLQGEAWFDVLNVKRADRDLPPSQQIFPKLRDGKPIELLTGLWTDNEAAPPGSNHNGKPYDFVARNYRPDHVAILPDQTGACSVQDGCGISVNQLRQDLDLLLNGGSGDAAVPFGSAESLSRLETKNEGTEENDKDECDCGGTCDECKAKMGKETTNAAW